MSLFSNESMHKWNVDDCFSFKLRFRDPRTSNFSVLYLSSGDFWGTLLMLNPNLKYTTFRNLSIMSGLHTLLFKTLFKPPKNG